MTLVLVKGFWAKESAAPAGSGAVGLTRSLGRVLYTDYLYAFEVAAAILMVAMVAAVALTLRRRKGAIYTSAAKAVRVDSKDRLRLVEMEADTAWRYQSEQPESKKAHFGCRHFCQPPQFAGFADVG